MAEAAVEAPHPCNICLEPMAPSEAYRGGISCAHAFCRSCIEGHVRAKVESGHAATVGCLDATCGSKLDPELCRSALPGDVFERWCAALCESIFVGARRTYCPFPDCSEMMVVDDDLGERVMQSECQVCRRLFCAQCGVPWHAGADCAAYKNLGKVDTAREDMMLLEMAKGKKWKRCPKCQFFVEKTEAACTLPAGVAISSATDVACSELILLPLSHFSLRFGCSTDTKQRIRWANLSVDGLKCPC